MAKEMIISVNGGEKKIAILDNGRVTEFYIERGEENSGVVGNIYKGRVQRVLPGMQSAFVDIGLERDAFLYVSDFFDEEEEIERIVMEKSKKGSPEDAKREAIDHIDRARIAREKQMESVQEIAEPLVELTEQESLNVQETQESQESQEPERKSRNRRRGKRGGSSDQSADSVSNDKNDDSAQTKDKKDKESLKAGSAINIDEADNGFERIIDDEETGELFKDAYVQEAIIDQVRAIEFDIESVSQAEVGSLLSSVDDDNSRFMRVADEDEADEAPVKKPSRSRRSGKKTTAKAEVAETTEEKPKPKRSRKKATEPETDEATVEPSVDEKIHDTDDANDKRGSSKKKPRGRAAKAAKAAKGGQKSDSLEDGDASVTESADRDEMSVRRGGRGRRRGGRPRKTDDNGDFITETPDIEDTVSPDAVFDEVAVEIVAESRETPTEEANNNRDDNRNKNPRRDTRDKRGPRSDSRGDNRSDRNDRNDRRDRPPTPAITDLLREGQEIIVQIAKEPIARKGARITSHIALPGRFLVYMPTIEHLGVSRKIESANERGRLRTLIQRIKNEETIPSGGFIVRTAGVGISEEDLRQDARYLVRTWLDIKKSSEKAKSPALVHQDLDIVQRLLRDQLSDEFSAIRVDSEEEYLRTVEFINRIQPRLVNRVKLYTRDEPILESYGVQEEIEKALKPRVWLKSGGYLVINQTEALVAIDVNTGKFVGKGNARLEDTITRTNMEAVDEIARQIRLRDLGGIIVLDLIDMEDRRNRQKVSNALQDALSSDKSPTKVLSFNDFGLIIMTRKRVKQSLERTMCAPCEYCEGAGWVKSPQTVCYEILSEARRLAKNVEDVRQTTLRIHPDVVTAFRTTEKAVFDEIEAHIGNVDLSADKHIHQAQFDFAFV